jgi:hypothetical protein
MAGRVQHPQSLEVLSHTLAVAVAVRPHLCQRVQAEAVAVALVRLEIMSQPQQEQPTQAVEVVVMVN